MCALRGAGEKLAMRPGCLRELGYVPWDQESVAILSDARIENYSRSLFPTSPLQQTAYSRVLTRLNNSQHVIVLALGGSAVYGADCRDEAVAQLECSFPGRFVRSLRRSYCMDEAQLRFVNHASGGQGTVASLPQLESLLKVGDPSYSSNTTPDLVIIDFSINDVTMGLYMGKHSGITSLPADVEAATEVMLREILTSSPASAILMVDQECRGLNVKQRFDTIEAHRRVSYAYGVPYLSYGDMLRGECANESFSAENAKYVNHVHPGHRTHQFTAEALAAFWWRGLSLLPSASLGERLNVTSPDGPYVTNESRRSKFAVCRAVCRYDARELYGQPSSLNESACGTLSNVTVVEGNFSLFEDRPGKPGWITTGPVGSAIEFGLNFGASPRLTLVVDQSYEGFGDAEVTFDGHPHSSKNRAWARGTRSDSLRVTTAEVISFNVQQISGITPGFGMWPHSQNQRMRLTLRTPGKFKLRHVSSC